MDSGQLLAAYGLNWQQLLQHGYDTVTEHTPSWAPCETGHSTYCLTCRKPPLNRPGYTAITMTQETSQWHAKK